MSGSYALSGPGEPIPRPASCFQVIKYSVITRGTPAPHPSSRVRPVRPPPGWTGAMPEEYAYERQHMIYYLAASGHTYTMQTFLDHWERKLTSRIQILTYDEALRAETLPVGTYIFADLERLLPSERTIASIVWDQLHAAGSHMLNHPVRSWLRFDLLTGLHKEGRNSFRAVRANDRKTPLTFPVFIRDESEHGGSVSDLLTTRHQVDQALAGAVVRGHQLGHLLVVEYCDTANGGGVYRKYAAFNIGGRIVPGHVDCSKQWVVKDTDLVDPETLSLEREYLESNPHRDWVEEMFALAHVDYGRIDYSLLGDVPQVWEINTNPILILEPSRYTESHMPTKHFLAGTLTPALEALDTVEGSATVKIDVPIPLFTRLDLEKKQFHWARMHRKNFRRLKGSAPFRIFRHILHPLLSPLAPLLIRSGRNGRETH